METQKTPNSQSSLEGKKNGAGGIRLPDFRLNYKTTVIQTASLEQNRESRNKFMQLWLINLQQRRQKYTMEKRQSLQ